MKSFLTVERAVEAANLKVINRKQGHLTVECPAHSERTPSMSVDHKGDKTLLHCFGCNADVRDLAHALGLTIEDLFDEEPSREKPMVVARYPYDDGLTGEVLFQKIRLFPKSFRIMHPDGVTYGLPKNVKPWLYHAGDLRIGLDKGETIWIVEGEADVHAMESLGAVATTTPMGAGKRKSDGGVSGKWTPFHTSLLARAKDVRIVVDLDSDSEDGSNVGRDYALEVKDALRARGIPVSLWRAKAGKDASDHVREGFGLEDFRRYEMPRTRPPGITHAQLIEKQFKPLIFAVEKILPQGLAILAAQPKAGKSWMSLSIAMGVASGAHGRALSELSVTPGDVLYVAMEDSERRLQSRTNLLGFGDKTGLDRIEFHPIESRWPGGNEGMAMMEEWAESVKEPRLVVIDTLAKVEPDLDEARDRYRAEYAMTSRYKEFADRHDLTVLWIHHDRKAESEDWLSRISGSRGLTGGVDTILFLEHKRGEPIATLRITGRDVEGDDLPLVRRRGLPFWDVDKTPSSPFGIELDEGPASVVMAMRAQDSHSLTYQELCAAFTETPEGVLDSYLAFLVAKGHVHIEGRDNYRLPH